MAKLITVDGEEHQFGEITRTDEGLYIGTTTDSEDRIFPEDSVMEIVPEGKMRRSTELVSESINPRESTGRILIRRHIE